MNWASVSKKVVKVLFVNALIFAALVGTSELAVYYLYRYPPAIEFIRNSARKYYRNFHASIISFDPRCAVYSPTLSYILKPGTCTFSNPEFSTKVDVNSRGLRDDEISLKAPEIIALGDSFTMGWGVEQEETYPQQIEAMTGIRTLNTGIASYGTAREFILLETLDTSNLKHLIIQYNGNDVNENMAYMSTGNRLHTMRQFDYQFAREQRRQQLRPNYYFGKYLREFLPRMYESGKKWASGERNDSWHTNRKITQEVDFFLNVIQHTKVDLRGVQRYVFDLSSYGRNTTTSANPAEL